MGFIRSSSLPRPFSQVMRYFNLTNDLRAASQKNVTYAGKIVAVQARLAPQPRESAEQHALRSRVFRHRGPLAGGDGGLEAHTTGSPAHGTRHSKAQPWSEQSRG